ncbi:hypothetical protein KBD81_00640 [Candidatus Woesebacteria bacterium]|nr:hypothetical protein [Candidatus Woesebacteria bacterium]
MFDIMLRHQIWEYLSLTQKDLIQEGGFLGRVVQKERFKDYSFLVFPYAKAYEGYLKQLFLDIDFMTHLDYISDHFRLGKFLSPHLMHRLEDRSIYAQIRNHATEDFAKRIWEMWSKGRNEVFHYYPHNLRRIEFSEATELNDDFLRVMIEAYDKLHFLSHRNGKAR